MPETEGYGWPYPGPGDPPEIDAQIRDLAEAVEETVANLETELAALQARLAPGRVPAERIATTIATADSSSFTTETGVMEVTAALVAGRTYQVRLVCRLATDTSGDNLEARMYEDSSSGDQIGFDRIYNIPAGAPAGGILIEAEHTAATTGDKTFVVTGALASGTGPARLEANPDRPGFLYVGYIRG